MKNIAATGQVSGQVEAHEAIVTLPVAPPVAVVVLIRLIGSSGPLGNSEILTNLGLRDRAHLRERYIDPALADGLVERTIPDKRKPPCLRQWCIETPKPLLAFFAVQQKSRKPPTS